MAGRRFSVTVVRALTISADDTIVQLLAAANQRVLVERISITGKGNAAADVPVQMDLMRQSTAGTGGTAVTPRAFDTDDDETLQVSALKGDFSAEPTAGDVVLTRHVHPISGHELVFPPGRELIVSGGERLALKAIAPAQASIYAVTIEGVE